MAHSNGEDALTEQRRQEIFLALVEAQDQAMPVPQSVRVIGERFGISEGRVRQIEREGLDKGWLP